MEKNISKEWCIHMSQLEGDAEIGVGLLGIDPVFAAENSPGADREVSEFTEFIRDASAAEKIKVYTEVMKRASAMQKKVLDEAAGSDT